MGVLARLVGPLLLPLALGAGMFLQIVYPGDFDYVLTTPAPAWIAWFAVVGAVAALVVGLRAAATRARDRRGARRRGIPHPGRRRRPPRLEPARPARDRDAHAGARRSVRDEVEAGTIVYSDSETSFRLAAFAPVYIAVAPPGHVADTEENRPYERAADARRFLRTGDLSIPREYGAEFVVVDGLRTDLELDLPVVYEDERFTLYRL